MPIYEYICQECQTPFELIRPMGQADAPAPCPACGKEEAKRKLALFYAHSGGHSVSGTSGGCGSCAGGNCAGCAH